MRTSMKAFAAATLLGLAGVVTPALADETDPPRDLTISGYVQGPRLLTLQSATDDSGFDYALGATYAVTPHLSVGASYVGVDGSASEAD